MKTGGKVLLGLVVFAGATALYLHFSKPKSTHSLNSGSDENNKSEPENLPIFDEAPVAEEKKQETRTQTVVAVSTGTVYRASFDDKGAAVVSGGILYPVKGGQKLGQFIKNVLVHGYPFVYFKDINGNDGLINKTFTKIES
jgi:hypothetical protein